MDSYNAKNIRNIAVLGHLGSGKTSLVEALVFSSGGIKVKGEVEKKNTISDFTAEEQAKMCSYSSAVVPIYWNDYKINLIDLPGSDEFLYDVNNALNVVKGAILVIDGSKGVEVVTKKHWQLLKKKNIPFIIYVNKLDKENINYDNILNSIISVFGKKAVPFCWPIGHDNNFDGFVNVVDLKARKYNGNECVDAEIWDDKKSKVFELHNMICESVAETDEKLLDKFFNGDELTKEEIHLGLRKGVLNGDLHPVLVGSATKNVGVHTLMDMINLYMPSPADLKPIEAIDFDDKKVTRKTTNDEPFSAYVFKTIVDPFIGVTNIIKVISGTIKNGDEVMVSNVRKIEKVSQLSVIKGKNQEHVSSLNAGDIGAITKMENCITGVTLSMPKQPCVFPSVIVPAPVMYVALTVKDKASEDKISQVLHKITLEDPTSMLTRPAETKQQLLGGQGSNHINHTIEKIKNMYKIEVITEEQKISYRETIKNDVTSEGRYVKQSGGSGYYGVVVITFSPANEVEFLTKVVGGSVPKNYFPAVEKGFYDALIEGPLAGYPVINIKATLIDGKCHAVDSNEHAFKGAAKLAFNEAYKKANPTILEPIMKVMITVADEYVGDVMSDVPSRRGHIITMTQIDDMQVIEANIPEAEITKYSLDLKAMTQGNGSFTREFLRYEEVRTDLIEKIVSENRREKS